MLIIMRLRIYLWIYYYESYAWHVTYGISWTICMDFNSSREGRDKLDVITIEGKESSCEFRRPCKRGVYVYRGLCVPCGRLWKYNSLLPYPLFISCSTGKGSEPRPRSRSGIVCLSISKSRLATAAKAPTEILILHQSAAFPSWLTIRRKYICSVHAVETYIRDFRNLMDLRGSCSCEERKIRRRSYFPRAQQARNKIQLTPCCAHANCTYESFPSVSFLYDVVSHGTSEHRQSAKIDIIGFSYGCNVYATAN